jgi:hypothetical protein
MAEQEEDWEKEMRVPAQGRLVYMGQGQCHFVHFHEATPAPLWPKKKKKKKKKKKATSSPESPPPPPSSSPPEPAEDWEAEITAAAPRQLEDWDAEIAASQ